MTHGLAGARTELQDALLDTPPVVCQSACCISALVVEHTTPSIIHTCQRQYKYMLLSETALVAFKISFLPTAFNYCKPSWRASNFRDIFALNFAIYDFPIFWSNLIIRRNYCGGFFFPDITALQLSARLEAPSESLRSHLLASWTEVLV